MRKPIILTVDDDQPVLRALERDLRTHYSSDYRIMRADSGDSALDAVRQLKLRDDPLALIVSDQRMPGMTGVELIEAVRPIYPDCKRVLLTAYADTEAAISAINDAKVDYYLRKPWDPPDLHLYPILDDLLDTWMATYSAPYDGIRVLGHRWSLSSHRVRDFLARNMIPFLWLDVALEQTDPKIKAIVNSAKVETQCLPAVIFPDGAVLEDPQTTDIAEKIGLLVHAERPFYDLIIVGGGPAGLAAAVYGASEGLRTVMIEREAPGGQAGTSSLIENYLGFPQGVAGGELARRSVRQAKKFGVEILSPQTVTGLRIEGNYKIVSLGDGGEIRGFALLIAAGVCYRKLEIPNAERLTGAGVFYGAAMTEALSCRDSNVFIVGGANSAGQAAIYLAGYASHVTMLVRGPSLAISMSKYLIDEIEKTHNISVRVCTRVTSVEGEEVLDSITLMSDDGVPETVPARALFIFIGAEPYTDWLGDLVMRDSKGYLITGPALMADGHRPKGWDADRDPYLLETNIPGVFAAGDVRLNSIKRVASSVGEGSIAVQFVHQYLGTVPT